MTVNEYKKQFIEALPSFYDDMERLNLFYLLIEEVMGLTRSEVVLNGGTELTVGKIQELQLMVKRLQQNEPVQYILEKACFFGYDFKVSPATLIPRPETEELTAWILEVMQLIPEKKWRILDIGTGSGCIPVTLKKEFPSAEVTGIDFSAGALEVAEENARNLNAEVLFVQQDILKTSDLEPYDIIVSNPPYVRNVEKEEINKNVLDHEPHSALFVEDGDPLIFYRSISKLAKNSLSDGGMLFFEINQYLGTEMKVLVSHYFHEVELRKDFMKNDRMMKASMPIKSL